MVQVEMTNVWFLRAILSNRKNSLSGKVHLEVLLEVWSPNFSLNKGIDEKCPMSESNFLLLHQEFIC